MPKIENSQKLFLQTETRFDELNYAKMYKSEMLRILCRFKEFAISINPQKYSTDIGEAFIKNCYSDGNLFIQDGVQRIVDKVNDVYLHGTFEKRCLIPQGQPGFRFSKNTFYLYNFFIG